jgi:alkyl hydroperoxide reductase subunit F
MYDIDINSYESVVDIKKKKDTFLVTTDEGEYESRSVIVSTGATPKRLGVENEGKFIGKGISYCVTCDEVTFEGKTVVVVGSGNAGLEAALELTRFATKVYVIEIRDELTGDGVLIDQVRKNKKIEIKTSIEVKLFKGGEKLEKIVYLDKRDKEEKALFIDGCFVEIGTIPNTDFLKGFVDLNEKDEIVVNPKTFQTSVEGVFAAGDVVDFRDKQVVIATGQGAIAALSAFRYLNSF